MTTEIFTPPAPYVIDGIGPYAVGHEYNEGALTCIIDLNGVLTELSSVDFSASPTASETSGNVYLSEAISAAYDTGHLYVIRNTNAEQGWIGVGGAREVSLEKQVDRLSRAVQELQDQMTRTFRVPFNLPKINFFVDDAAKRSGRFIICDEDGNPKAGPTGSDIENAQTNAAYIAGIAAQFGDVATAITAAETAQDKAEQWAENPEDVEVDPGQYSALHHSQKSEDFSNISSGHADRAQAAEDGAVATMDAIALLGASNGAYYDTTITAAVASGVSALVVGDYFTASADDVSYIGLYEIETGPVASLRHKFIGFNSAAKLTDLYSGAANVTVEVTGILQSGIISSTTGNEVSNSFWLRTDFIRIQPGLSYTTNAVFTDSTATKTWAVYNANKTFMGIIDYRDSSGLAEDFSTYLGAAFFRVTSKGTDAFQVYAVNASPVGTEGLSQLSDKIVGIDYFTGYGTVLGSMDLAGAIDLTATNWLTTGFVSVSPGQLVNYKGRHYNVETSAVVGYDASKNFVCQLFNTQGDITFDNDVNLVVPNGVSYIRATAVRAYDHNLIVNELRPLSEPLHYAPSEIYAVDGEDLYIYPRSICPHPAYRLVPSVSEGNERFIKLGVDLATAGQPDPVKINAVGPDGSVTQVADMQINVAALPLVDPIETLNIVTIADSTMETEKNAGAQGVWINELSRRLTGVGDPILTGAQSPAAGTLTNIKVRGTRGDLTVKHEGRPGWSIQDYVTLSSKAGVSNAFWSGSAFSMSHYLSTNGFDLTGDPTGGVNATGSNMLVIIQLGWNGVYESTSAQDAYWLDYMCKRIEISYPDAKILLLGMTPAPVSNYKYFVGDRDVSDVDIFKKVIVEFGSAWQEVADRMPNRKFLPVAPCFDAETGYPTEARAVSDRSDITFTATIDHVHPGRVGYAYIADVPYRFVVWEFCQ